MGCPGKPSCHRIIMARLPPMRRKIRLISRNWIPMILWSVEKMYFRMNGRSSTSAWAAGSTGGAIVAIGPLYFEATVVDCCPSQR